MNQLKEHPVAELIPVMGAKCFAELKEDIARRGQKDPIALSHEGFIVDGRHRYRACVELGIEPLTFTLPESEDLERYSMSRNYMRRDHSQEQRTAAFFYGNQDRFIAIEAEAKKRKAKGGKKAGRGRPNSLACNQAKLSDGKHKAGKTSVAVARELKVGTSTVEVMRLIHKKAPELLKKIMLGELGSQKAAWLAAHGEPEDKLVATDKNPVSAIDEDYKRAAKRVRRIKILGLAFKMEVNYCLDLVAKFKSKCKKEDREDLKKQISKNVTDVLSIGDWLRTRFVGAGS